MRRAVCIRDDLRVAVSPGERSDGWGIRYTGHDICYSGSRRVLSFDEAGRRAKLCHLTRCAVARRARHLLNCLYPPLAEVLSNPHMPHHGVALAHVQLRDAIDVRAILHLMQADHPYDREV